MSRDHEYYFQVQGQIDGHYWTTTLWLYMLDTCKHSPRANQVRSSFVQTDECEAAMLLCFSNFPPVFILAPKKEMHILMKLQDFIVTVANERYIANMVLCDSPSCKYGWFHFPSVNLTAAPAGGCRVLSRLQTVNMTLYITLLKCMTYSVFHLNSDIPWFRKM